MAMNRLLTRSWCGGEEASWQRGDALRAHHQACSICFRNLHSDWSYECTRKRVDVFEKGITLHDLLQASLAVATSCRLQLFAVLGNAGSNLTHRLHYMKGLKKFRN